MHSSNYFHQEHQKITAACYLIKVRNMSERYANDIFGEPNKQITETVAHAKYLNEIQLANNLKQ